MSAHDDNGITQIYKLINQNIAVSSFKLIVGELPTEEKIISLFAWKGEAEREIGIRQKEIKKYP